jgi:hypothetical protein
MESLVATNSPESIDVDVVVLVNLPKRSVPTPMRWAGQRAGWPRARPGPASPYVAEASAKQRLSRSLHRTTGDRLQRSLHIPVEALSRSAR